MEDIYKKPPQRVSYAEKVKNNFELCRKTMDYYIGRSRFAGGRVERDNRDLISFFKIYNNDLPASWFNFVTNPLNTQNEMHKSFPARIRKMNILRTNLDRLIGEFNKRPFKFGVENKSEDSYNNYLDQRMEAIKQNIYQNFINMIPEGELEGEMPREEVPPPEKMLKEFDSNYQDALAIKAQKLIGIIEEEADLIEKFTDMFKTYLITGTVCSFKEVFDDKLIYEEVSPVEIDYDKSHNDTYIADAEWVVQEQWWTIADVCDRFYHELKEGDYKNIESRYNTRDIHSFAQSIGEFAVGDYVKVRRVFYTSQKKIGIFTYPDPDTGELQMEEVDDTFKVPDHLKDLSSLKWEWRNEYWMGYQINGDIYADIHTVEKNPFNGRNYSDSHAQNISVLEMGIPYLILYIIMNYRLELTIARSKGKVVLMDKNVIPVNDGWDEEKFIYYSEALGWGLVDRNQIGVDKSFNQYQVVDLSLHQHIREIIEIIEYVKRQWDEIVGMNDYRKGQTAPSAGKGLTERQVFQGSIVSDMIFFTFESFMKKEYQDILDLTKYMNQEGLRRIFLNSDMNTELLEILPEDFVFADLGIHVVNSSIEQDRIRELKNYAQQSLANGGKLSMVADIVAADSMAEVKRMVNTAERKEIELAQQNAASEQEGKKEIEMIRKEFEQFKQMLETQHMHQEYDRKENIEHIKGQYNQLSFTSTMDANQNDVPDSLEIAKNAEQVRKNMDNHNLQLKNIQSKEKIEAAKLRDKEKDRKLKDKEIESKEKIEQLKARTALKNKVAGE